MKKLLLGVMIFGYLNIFASGYEQLDQQKKLQSKIETLRAEQQKKEKELLQEREKLTQKIRAEENVLYDIKEKERHEKQYGQYQEHAKQIENALKAAEYQKQHPIRARFEDDACDDCIKFLNETDRRKNVARDLIDAIGANESFTCECDCCCCGCYCCNYDRDRTDFTYLRDGAILLAQNKLTDLKSQQSVLQGKLNPVVQKTIRFGIIEEPVQPQVIEDRA